MPSFRSILPLLREVGVQTLLVAHHIRVRPPAVATGTRHELMFDPLMRDDEMIPREQFLERGYHR